MAKRSRSTVPVPGVEHGTKRGYDGGGCGCEACSTWNNERVARRQAARTAVGLPKRRTRSRYPGRVKPYPKWIDIPTLAAVDVLDDSWEPDGLCYHRGELLDQVFFPENVDKHALGVAEAYCDRCPVRYECLAREVAASNDWLRGAGIFAGTTGTERKLISGALTRYRNDQKRQPA